MNIVVEPVVAQFDEVSLRLLFPFDHGARDALGDLRRPLMDAQRLRVARLPLVVTVLPLPLLIQRLLHQVMILRRLGLGLRRGHWVRLMDGLLLCPLLRRNSRVSFPDAL